MHYVNNVTSPAQPLPVDLLIARSWLAQCEGYFGKLEVQYLSPTMLHPSPSMHCPSVYILPPWLTTVGEVPQ